MLVQQSKDLNKENQDYINRIMHTDNNKNNRKIQSDEEEQSSQNQSSNSVQMKLKLLVHIKKQKFKNFIAKHLTIRRQKDRQNSHKQIYQEVQMFKAFSIWKKMALKARRLRAQAQMFKEKKQFSSFKRFFQEWANLIKKPKQQNYKIKQKWFQALKIICMSEISLRLRRIHLQNFIIKKRTLQMAYYLRQQLNVKEIKMLKAQNFWERRVKSKTFVYLKKIASKDIRQRLRYQQYKLAYLFRSKCLLSRSFNAFKSQ